MDIVESNPSRHAIATWVVNTQCVVGFHAVAVRYLCKFLCLFEVVRILDITIAYKIR